MDHNISWLTTVPATDVNFKSHLKMATTEEIKEAISIMDGQGRKGNASRITACERELRKRDRRRKVV
ncbi:hypothetical protein C806_00101 [Lachnospiraceae bacterium 3-1]|nr:hypothetical protein C806_00101 [Lachnospiraceae bacterium 3-1]